MGFNEVTELLQVSFMVVGLILILPIVFTIRLIRFLKE